MNKAFVREPEDTGQRHCPRCGSLGESVGPDVLQEHLRPEARSAISDTAFFCPYPQCAVAYFDLFERLVEIDALARPVWPKDLEAPICACFGLTRDDVEADLAEGTVRRTKETVQRANSPEARCSTLAANGRSCVGEVQRYYMKRRGGQD